MTRLTIALVETLSDSTHVYSRTPLPRVGIATIGAVLKNMGWPCDIYYKPLSRDDRNRLKTYDVVGIGSLSNTISEAYRLADALKGPKTTVVMGGPHASFMPEEALDHCDYVVIGEGEDAFPALVQRLETNTPVSGVEGLAFQENNETVYGRKRSPNVDFKTLPSPDFGLSPQLGKKEDIPPILVTSRGCPHDCSFCSVTAMFGRKYRFKSVEQVISELQPVLHRSVCFGDDNFCANPVHTKKLLREMIARKSVPLRWSGQMCVNAASDDEMLDLMQQTHCRTAYIGIESVNPDTLKKYGKQHHVDEVAKCVEKLHDHRIGIHGMFVVDADDAPDTARRIVDYAIETDMETIQIFSLTPFPGTKSFEDNKDRILHRHWNWYDGMHVVVEPRRASAHDMQRAIIDQMKRFYSLKRGLTAYRPHRAWRVKYRLGGHVLLKQWERENKDYLDRLKSGDWH